MIKYSNIKALVIHLKHLTQSVYDILLVIINRDYLPVKTNQSLFAMWNLSCFSMDSDVGIRHLDSPQVQKFNTLRFGDKYIPFFRVASSNKNVTTQ